MDACSVGDLGWALCLALPSHRCCNFPWAANIQDHGAFEWGHFAGLGLSGAFLCINLFSPGSLSSLQLIWAGTWRDLWAFGLSTLVCCVVLMQPLGLKLLRPSSALCKMKITWCASYTLLCQVTQNHRTCACGSHFSSATGGLWAAPTTQPMCTDLHRVARKWSLLGMLIWGHAVCFHLSLLKREKLFPGFQLVKGTFQEQQK